MVFIGHRKRIIRFQCCAAVPRCEYLSISGHDRWQSRPIQKTPRRVTTPTRIHSCPGQRTHVSTRCRRFAPWLKGPQGLLGGVSVHRACACVRCMSRRSAFLPVGTRSQLHLAARACVRNFSTQGSVSLCCRCSWSGRAIVLTRLAQRKAECHR